MVLGETVGDMIQTRSSMFPVRGRLPCRRALRIGDIRPQRFSVASARIRCRGSDLIVNLGEDECASTKLIVGTYVALALTARCRRGS